MHWKKNRIVHPEAKAEIIHRDECPGCGAAVTFYYGENTPRCCPDCRKGSEEEWRTEIAEKRRKHRGWRVF
jgi:hypothetical protein